MGAPERPTIVPGGRDPARASGRDEAPDRRPPALGSDPFEAPAEDDALGEWLEALDRVAARPEEPGGAAAAVRDAGETAAASTAGAPDASGAAPEPPRRRGVAVSEVEVPPEASGLERFVGEDARRRFAALQASLEENGRFDRFGLSVPALRRTFPAVYALYRLYFRVTSHGHEHIPVEGPAILAANHGGLLPFDGAMTVMDVALHTDPPRLARAVVDRWAGSLPFVNVWFARVGQVVGTRENVAGLLDQGELVLVFPEGMEGIRKPVTQRYRLQRFHVGFVEQALRTGAPIVPTAILGADDQAPILYDVKPLARRLGLPVAPITPTFPWLGPLGLLPYPVRYRIVYGEPLALHERYGPEAADDAALVRTLAQQVRSEVQRLVDRSR